jgi:hypothetical protein
MPGMEAAESTYLRVGTEFFGELLTTLVVGWLLFDHLLSCRFGGGIADYPIDMRSTNPTRMESKGWSITTAAPG